MLEQSRALGLPEVDLNTATEFLKNHEYGLCLDTVLTQLFEHGIAIDAAFYHLVVEITEKMDLKEADYVFMRGCIK